MVPHASTAMVISLLPRCGWLMSMVSNNSKLHPFAMNIYDSANLSIVSIPETHLYMATCYEMYPARVSVV